MIAAALLFDLNRDLAPFQMLTMRAVIAITTNIVWLNCGLKAAVWDSIQPKQITTLIFRTVQGAYTTIIGYALTKYLNLTILAIVDNLVPLFTIILAYMILKEKLKSFELTIMLLSLVSVLLFSIFTNGTDDGSRAKSSIPLWVLYAALASTPLLNAGGNIAMRKMKKFHEAVVSWYLAWSIGIISVTIVLISGEGFEIFTTFDWRSWVLMAIVGILAVFSQTTRFKALKYQKAATLQIL